MKTILVTAGNKLTPVMLEKIRNFARLSGIQEPISVTQLPKTQ